MSLFLISTILYITFLLFLVIALVMFFISNIKSSVAGAPFVPMNSKVVPRLLEFGGLSGDDNFYDLGCGDGRVLVSAANDFHVSMAIGYDLALVPYLLSRWRVSWSGFSERVLVFRRNFMEGDYKTATFVYLYLFPKVVDHLAGKLAKELRPGTRVLAPSFPIDLARHPEFTLLKSEKVGKITAYLYEKK